MSDIPLQLPCRAHRGCTYHKHWSPSVPAPGPKAASKNSSDVKPSSVPPEDSSTVVKVAPIQCLPTELLRAISAYLAPTEQACLALTCHSLARVFGSEAWTKLSIAGKASWFMHAEMLDLLQKDLSSDEYWRCRECLLFHRRSKSGQRDMTDRLEIFKTRLSAVFERARTQHSLRMGVLGDPNYKDDALYVLDGGLVKAVMDRHYLGASEGLCLNSLKCKGTRTFPLSTTANMVLTYDFTPKIVLDRLLLQSTYRFQSQLTMFILNMAIEETSTPVFLEHIDFWICGHESTSSILRSLQLPSGFYTPRRYEGLRCRHCPTQYEVTVIPHEGVRIRAWQNLGSGRSQADRKFRHITSIGKRRRKYRWHGQENLERVFAHVLCSTKKEFQSLAAQAEHWQLSYGRPRSKNFEYKSLPTKLAERL